MRPRAHATTIFYTGTPCCSNGWTIDRFPGDFTTNETAVWQTVSDVGPSFLTFTMFLLDPNPGHLLGRFRWSVTTDDRATYADPLREDGNVTANWTVLTNPVMQIPTGMSSTVLPDNSVLLGGAHPGQGLYQVKYLADLAGITGIRLEILKDSSLPAGGPGFYANGNFVLTKLQLNASAVPEPSASGLLLSGLLLIIAGMRRKALIHVRRVKYYVATVLLLAVASSGVAGATPVQLQNATATFSQGPFGGGPYPPSQAIDGSFSPGVGNTANGWAIDRFPGDFTTNETAVLQTVPDLGPSFLIFTMSFLHWNPGHLLGRFRLSVTTDDRSTYADGLSVGGNVTANWTVLNNVTVQGPPGMTFMNLPDDSVLAAGVVPGQGVYDV